MKIQKRNDLSIDAQRLTVRMMRHLERRVDAESPGLISAGHSRKQIELLKTSCFSSAGRLRFDLQCRAVRAQIVAFVRPNHQVPNVQAASIGCLLMGLFGLRRFQ
jgi:UDP-N-acetylmuramyl pentapeptide synthase